MSACFRAYDFERNSVIGTVHARLALKQCYGFLNREMETAISEMETETWDGERTINFNRLVLRLAKDPPGYVRTTLVLPKIVE